MSPAEQSRAGGAASGAGAPALLRGGLAAAAAVLRAAGPARHGLADAIGTVAYLTDSRRRANALANHRRLGVPGEAEARRRARASFREYARTNVDFVWANGMTSDEVAASSRLLGSEHVDAATAGGRGAVLALTHHGSWDFAALIAWSYGLQLTAVMAPVGNPAITSLVVWAREGNALEVYTTDGAARGLLRALRRRRFVALLCDLPEGGPETTVRFCGGPSRFSLAPAWLALRTGAPLLPVDCRRGGRGEPPYVITTFAPVVPGPDDDAASVMQRVATVLEGAVRAHPDQWYPFRHLEAGADEQRAAGAERRPAAG